MNIVLLMMYFYLLPFHCHAFLALSKGSDCLIKDDKMVSKRYNLQPFYISGTLNFIIRNQIIFSF